MRALPSSPAAAEHHEAALAVARAEAEARTWQAAEQLLTEFYQRESRAQ